MNFVDKCHQAGIGVIMDWVPAHFPKDGYGLYMFDGQPCYEDPNPRRGEHKEWGTMVFNYGMPEVESFWCPAPCSGLKSTMWTACVWTRLPACCIWTTTAVTASGSPTCTAARKIWKPIAFLRKLNTEVLNRHPEKLMIAEESTAWPLVSKPAADGGLGFNFKWNMGWMNDMLSYMSTDPLSGPAITTS